MLPLELLQDALVTLVALGAGAVVLRRALGFVRSGTKPGCASCPSAGGGRSAQTTGRAASGNTSHPLVLVRPPRR